METFDYFDNFTRNETDVINVGNNSDKMEGNGSELESGHVCPTSYCLPIAITLSSISIVGLVTNMIVIVVIARDKRLHQPTFVIICSLAIADFTFFVARYPRYIVQVFFKQDVPRENYIAFKLFCDVLGLLTGGASILHVMLMSAVRYFIVVYPLKSHIFLNNERVCLMCVGMWIFSGGIATLYTCAVLIKLEAGSTFMEVTNIVITITMSILPVVVIATLHLLKAKVLLDSISKCTKTVQNMSRVVTFVVVCYIITTTPSNVVDVLILSFGYTYTQTGWFFVVSKVARVFLFLNFAINPFIYFVQSSQLQKSIAKCCGSYCRHPGNLDLSGSQRHCSATITSSVSSDAPKKP